MKKSSILLVIIGFIVLFLHGCASQNQEKKQDFLVETKSLSDISREVTIKKPGKIAGTEEITVSSQVAGRVGSIIKTDGQNVSGGQPVLQIKDSIADYDLQVQRAKNALDRSVLQYQQTKISLDKSVSDTATALELAENSYAVSQSTTEQSLKKAQLDYQNAGVQSEDLQLQFPVEKNNLLNLMDTALHQVDTYLGVTDKYKGYNNSYEIYLGVKDVAQKTQTEKSLYELYTLRAAISSFSVEGLTSEKVFSGVNLLDEGYKKTKQVLDGMKQVFMDSVSSSDFPQTTIDGYKSSIDGLNTSLQLANTAFVGYRKQIIALLSSAGSGTALVELSQEQADIMYTNTLINSQNALFNSEIGVRNAKTTYDTLLKNKDLQIGMAENGINDANVGYQDALSKFSKLSVRAPIAGVVGNVLVDVGQEVGPGTPLFTLVNNQSQLIEVYVTADESSYLFPDQSTQVVYGNQEFTGKIVSISSVADKNILYKVVVGLDRTINLIGDVATVIFPIQTNSLVLPLNIITPVSENSGYIWCLQGTGLEKINVQMGRVWDSFVEITSSLPLNTQVILTDVNNFDDSKFVIKKSN